MRKEAAPGAVRDWHELPDFNKGLGAGMSEGGTVLRKTVIFGFSICSPQ